MKYHKIIHYLLSQYHITYNYDEFYQLLLIKLWEVSKIYNPSSSLSLSSFIYQRLKYYLIDLFRKEKMKIDCLDITELNYSLTYKVKDESFLTDFKHILNSNEYQWLLYYLQGYKQYEIAKIMNLSETTIKKYKSSARIKLQRYYLEGDWHVTL